MRIEWTDAGETGTIITQAQGQADPDVVMLRQLAKNPALPADQREIVQASLETDAGDPGVVDVTAGEVFTQVVGVEGDGEPTVALVAELARGPVHIEISLSARGEPVSADQLRGVLDLMLGAL